MDKKQERERWEAVTVFICEAFATRTIYAMTLRLEEQLNRAYMFKRYTAIFCLLISSFCFAQSSTDSTNTPYRNIIGLDVTGLLSQFFNAGTGGYYNNSPYLVSYRRVIGRNSIRVGLGGSASNSNSLKNDSLEGTQRYETFNLRAGLEQTVFTFKRWSFYYGCDLFYNYRYHLYRNTDNIANYSLQQQQSHGTGLSPVCGIVFKLNSRVSLATEASFDVEYQVSSNDNNYGSVLYGSRETHTEGSSFSTQFNAPVLLHVRVSF